MRIVIQAADLDHPRIDGTRVYVRELLRRFGHLAPATSFVLYHRVAFNPTLAPPQFENYTEKRRPFPWAWMQTRFPWALVRHQYEKLFLPIQAAPFFVPRKTEVTVTIHDLAFKRYPETFPKLDRLKLAILLHRAVRRADKLIAVSQSTKDDLLHFFPALPPERIRVIAHGLDADFFGARISPAESQAILSRYGLAPQSYILHVGALQPRKNLVRLIQAFEIAKKSMFEMKLVLAGEQAWLAETILAAREKSMYRDDIILTGRLHFEELRALYQSARLCVFPSLYEGFGLPILEAFASGIPVLTASNSSLREVAGRAALYCRADSISDIAEKLERLWSEEEIRNELVVRGREQVKKFSWEKCARETLDFINA